MLKLFNRKKKDNKGFTLVELVVVIAILAILVGLLAPQYTKYVEKARKSSDASNLENMVKAVEVAIADPDDTKRVTTGTYTITIRTAAEASGTASDIKFGNDVLTTGKPAFDAIKETLGDDWTSTKLKSVNWGGTGTSTAISAEIVVGADGSFTVSYSPDDLSTMIGKGKKTS